MWCSFRCKGLWVRTAWKASWLVYCTIGPDVVGHPGIFGCIWHAMYWDTLTLYSMAVWVLAHTEYFVPLSVIVCLYGSASGNWSRGSLVLSLKHSGSRSKQATWQPKWVTPLTSCVPPLTIRLSFQPSLLYFSDLSFLHPVRTHCHNRTNNPLAQENYPI